MSQRVDFDGPQTYQGAYDVNALYQGQQAQPGNRHVFPQWLAAAGISEPTPPRYRVMVALASLLTLLIVVITLVAAVNPYYTSAAIVASLLVLGLVCATIVAINIAFNLRH